jgi:hypothetical protein
MAFPSVAGTNTTNGTTASASPVINLPANIVAGETLLVLVRVAGLGGIGFPAGWNELFDDASDASDDQTALAWRKADGNEGSSITLSSANAKFAAIAWRIAGAVDPTTQAPIFATLATGLGTLPDPASLDLGGTAKDRLILWLGAWEGEQTSPPSGTPTNFSNAIGADSGTAGAVATNCRVASADRTFTASGGFNAGSWTISVSDDWTATVIAFDPAPTERRGVVTWAELEVPDAPRRAVVTWAELEVPNAPRRAIVSWAELEVPEAPRRAVVTFAEFEVPDAPRRAVVTWAELEVPDAPRRAVVTWAELEVPNAPRRAIVTWAELEVPDVTLAGDSTFLGVVRRRRRARSHYRAHRVAAARRQVLFHTTQIAVPRPLLFAPVIATGSAKWDVQIAVTYAGDEPMNDGRIDIANKHQEITKPIIGKNATTGLDELWHGAAEAYWVLDPATDTKLGSISVSCPEIGVTAQYVIAFTTTQQETAFAGLTDGTPVYRIFKATSELRFVREFTFVAKRYHSNVAA